MYRLHHTLGAIITATGEHVRPIKSDVRWRDYLAWVKAGNVPAPAQADQEPLDTIRERVRSAIDQERARRHGLPVAYSGAVFDADSEARENITGTIARLVRGDGLPAGWIGWRDYGNAMHWATSTAADVLSALRGLSSAIEDRKQSLLIAAWIKKEEIAALDRAALEAYDATTGWTA